MLANISDLNDAEDIKNQTAGLMSTPDEVIYADLRKSVLSSESDIIFDIEDPVLAVRALARTALAGCGFAWDSSAL